MKQINSIAKWIRGRLTDKQKIALYGKLAKIGGKSGKDSIFQKASDKIGVWKPYEFIKIVYQLITKVLKIPAITKIATNGFLFASRLQDDINVGKIDGAVAGERLRMTLRTDPLAKKISLPSWLINFLAESVVLALKLMKK